MKQLIVRLGKGNLLKGCSDTYLQLYDADHHLRVEKHCLLPANLELQELYKRWQIFHTDYYKFKQQFSRQWIAEDDGDPDFIGSGGTSHYSDCSGDELATLGIGLIAQFQQWLATSSFNQAEQAIRTELASPGQEQLQITIVTEDAQLRKLPWWRWQLCEAYPQAGIALSALSGQRLTVQVQAKAQDQVRILGVLGDDTDIDLSTDEAEIQCLPDTDSTFLSQPSFAELHQKLWDTGCDVFFFAGHSASGQTNFIQLNGERSLTIFELQDAIKQATQKGLRLVILNSCDGLGLAEDLAQLNLPAVIVMREPVPNAVAQTFLKFLLQELTRDLPLDLAVIQAQRKLRGIEETFPGASLLPVLVHNRAEPLPTWSELRTGRRTGGRVGWNRWAEARAAATASPPALTGWRGIPVALLVGWMVTGLVMGIRLAGGWRWAEFPAYDWLLRSRPDPAIATAPPLVIVTVDPQDVKPFANQPGQGAGAIPDLALKQLLDKLVAAQPTVIGSMIHRDFAVNAAVPELKRYFVQKVGADSYLFLNSCLVWDEQQAMTIAPPPELTQPPADLELRVGFTDVLVEQDVVRRQLLTMPLNPKSDCASQFALSQLLAIQHLALQFPSAQSQSGIMPELIQSRILQKTFGRYDTTAFGGSQQILLNYRTQAGRIDMFETVPLRQILNGTFNPERVRGKIVLIAAVGSRSGATSHRTPYGTRVDGVVIQAQMITQILDAATGSHPPIALWDWPWEVGWVLVWASIGGLGVCWWRSPVSGIVILGAGVSLVAVSWVMLIHAVWIPLIPSVLALGGGWIGTQGLLKAPQLRQWLVLT